MKKHEYTKNIIIGTLIHEKLIPSAGIFQISENQLQVYINEYGKLCTKSPVGLKTKSNTAFARKMAGLNLLKENFSRGATYKDMKSGILYMIENEIYPEHYKIGMTVDLDNRLASYQTYDPYKRFR